MESLDRILGRLEAVGNNGTGFKAKCPVRGHGKGRGDRNPSLSVSERDGKVLLRCHAGCATEDIAAAVGLSMSDLFESSGRYSNERGTMAATYDYTDAAGNLLFQVARYEPKRFSLRRPNGTDKWITKGVFKDCQPVLYRLPRVTEAVREGITVWVFEGEEDVHAAEEHGLVATTNPMGAGKWRDQYSDCLHSADVVIVPDNDRAGQVHAGTVAESVRGRAESVRIVELPGLAEGEDFRDWVRRGGTADELLRLASKAPGVSPSPSSVGDDGDAGRGVPGFVSFGHMERPSDGRPFVVKGLIPQRFPTIVYGDGGTAKSLLGASLVLDIARGADRWLGRRIGTRGIPCGYVDFELDEQEQGRRMYQLSEGVGLERPPDNLYYLAAADHSAAEVLRATLEDCKRLGIGVVLLDSLGFALDGDAEASRDVMTFFRKHLDPFKAEGVTLVLVDHQAKLQAREAYHHKSPFGSVYKRNSTRSVIQVQAVDQRDGELRVRLRCNKSNFGAKFDPFDASVRFHASKIETRYRELAREDVAGEGSLSATDKVRAALRGQPSYPKDLAELTELGVGTVRNALTRLRKGGEVVPTGAKNEDGAEQVSLAP
jgi:hypothetical protein